MAKSPISSKGGYKPRPPLGLEAATEQTVTDLGGFPVVCNFPGVRVGRSTLFKYTDPSEENRAHRIPMDVAAVLTAESVRRGHVPHLLHWFLEQVEHCAQDAEEGALIALTARLAKEVGDVFADLSAALNPEGPGGKKLTPAERNKLIGDLLDLQRLSRGAIAMLERGQ